MFIKSQNIFIRHVFPMKKLIFFIQACIPNGIEFCFVENNQHFFLSNIFPYLTSIHGFNSLKTLNKNTFKKLFDQLFISDFKNVFFFVFLFQCCLSEDPVYIHPTSSLFTKLPEYIVFHEIIETSKSYMRCKCLIKISFIFPMFKKNSLIFYYILWYFIQRNFHKFHEFDFFFRGSS